MLLAAGLGVQGKYDLAATKFLDAQSMKMEPSYIMKMVI